MRILWSSVNLVVDAFAAPTWILWNTGRISEADGETKRDDENYKSNIAAWEWINVDQSHNSPREPLIMK